MNKYKLCPVCGANKWYPVNNVGFAYYGCNVCGATIPTKHINDRVLDWVPVTERLPDKDGKYFVLCRSEHAKFGKDTRWFVDGKFFEGVGIPVMWLDDRTQEKS